MVYQCMFLSRATFTNTRMSSISEFYECKPLTLGLCNVVFEIGHKNRFTKFWESYCSDELIDHLNDWLVTRTAMHGSEV